MRKISAVLGIFVVLVMGTVAFAANVGHIVDAPKVETVTPKEPGEGTVENIKSGINAALGNTTEGSAVEVTAVIVVESSEVSTLSLWSSDVSGNEELVDQFTTSPNQRVQQIGIIDLGVVKGEDGLNVVELGSVPTVFTSTSIRSGSSFSVLASADISSTRVFLKHGPTGKTALTYKSDGKLDTDEDYAFVNATGKEPSRYPTNTSKYLVMKLKNNSAYDLDKNTDAVEVAPILAYVAATSELEPSSGGCNSGISALALLVLAVWQLRGKKSVKR